MAKEFARQVLLTKPLNKSLIIEAISKLNFDIAYMEYAKKTFNRAAETQESIDESKELLLKLKNLL